MSFQGYYLPNRHTQTARGPLHVRPDEEPDVSYVLVSQFGDGCEFCGRVGHTRKSCPARESVGAVLWG